MGLGSLKKRRENKVIGQLEGKMAGELGERSIGDLKRRENEVSGQLEGADNAKDLFTWRTCDTSHQNILNNDIHLTYSGGCSMGFWLGSFRAWPAGLASASSVVNSSRVISTLPCGKAEK